ncbi:RNA polymerase sigma factor [Micromonospora chalcea]
MDDRTADKPKAPSVQEFVEDLQKTIDAGCDWFPADRAPAPAPDAVALLDGVPVQYECKSQQPLPLPAPERQRIVEEFSAFYRDRSTGLATFLVSIGVPRPDAWDIMQETMQKVFRFWDRIEHPWTWAKVTASKEYAKRLAKGAPLPVEDIAERVPPTPCDSSLAETKYDILTAMQKLPTRQRQVLAWSLDGHTPAEIAEHLQMTPEAVRASLYKSRKAVVELLRTQEAGDK